MIDNGGGHFWGGSLSGPRPIRYSWQALTVAAFLFTVCPALRNRCCRGKDQQENSPPPRGLWSGKDIFSSQLHAASTVCQPGSWVFPMCGLISPSPRSVITLLRGQEGGVSMPQPDQPTASTALVPPMGSNLPARKMPSLKSPGNNTLSI